MSWTTAVQPPTPEAKESSDKMKKMLQGPGAILCLLSLIAGGIAMMVWVVRLKVSYPQIISSQELTDKPQMDHRHYQWAKFSNGLEVLNIEDKNSHRSGFAMAIEAGSFSDPKELLGLAHFCEHMVFLGTEKFPEAGGLDTYLNMHGGSSNAYTADEVTVYFASLDGGGVSEGMDRFTDMFKAPLFDRKFVQKEVHAIESEHAKNVQSPEWRILNVMNSLADPESPVALFHTGNLNTLYSKPKAQGMDPVDELEKYFRGNYCPPRMRFVTFGQASVEKQQKEAFDKLASLSSMTTCQAHKPSFAEPKPYPPARLAKYVHIKGTQPQGSLWVLFDFPDLRKQYKHGATSYLTHVLTYGGEHSLNYVLREDLGLTLGMDTSTDISSARTAFYLIFNLTPKGTAHPELVLQALLLYIDKMKVEGVDEDLYNSLAKVGKLMWDWSEVRGSEDLVADMAERMTNMPQTDLLKGGHVITQPDPNLVKTLMNRLEVSNMNVGFVDPFFKKPSKSLKTKILPWYGVEYTIEDLQTRLTASNSSKHESAAKQFLHKLQAVNPTVKHLPKMVLPKPINHIPEHVTLDFAKAAPGDDELSQLWGAVPGVILNDGGKKVMWFRQGSMSTSPKVLLQTLLRTESGKAEVSARENLIFNIFSSMFSEELTPKTVDLTATGIGYSVGVSPRGLDFTFSGFKHNLPRMMNVVFKAFKKGVSHNAQRFHRIVQNLREGLKDKSSMPVDYALKDLSTLLSKNVHSNPELLKALKDIKLNDVTNAVEQHISNKELQLTSFVMGNVEESEAKSLTQNFEASLDMKTTLPISKVDILDRVVRPGRRVEIRKHNPRPNDNNHVTVVDILYGVPDTGENAIFSMIGTVLGPLVYEELRTKRQLGYLVQGGVSSISNVMKAAVIVQGNVMQPDKVEPLIDWLLAKRVPEQLANITNSEFQTMKDTWIKSVLEPPLGLSSEIEHYWPLAERGGVCPERLQEELVYVREELKDKQQLVDAWNRLIHPGKDKEARSRIVVKYFAKDKFHKIPQRPSEGEVRKSLEDLKLSSEAIDLMVLETKNALVLNRSSSKERAKVLALEGAGYYPAIYKCKKGPKVPGAVVQPTSISAISSKSGHASLIRSGKGHSNLRTA